ncbi:MAG: protein kinase, partial [Deltaproteobacteria bacterium]|nr:protein kinase [Deltaproteobacteria bacterium]
MIEAGVRVFEKYEIVRRLAVGGMGEIFLARQTGLVERMVILKSLLPDLAEQQDQLEQFIDEARVCANLNHPNVIAIYDVGQWEGVYFIAMEYVAGEDLSHLLRAAAASQTGIPLEVSAAIVRDAAAGLDHAHSASDSQGQLLNLVHRDVSPQNIMVRTDGVVKVVDFGIARAANREVKTAAGIIKGKYRYMSPEQALDKPLDGRSDQFALGVVLWELATGRRLFAGESPVQILTDVVRKPTPPPSTLVPHFPPVLEGVILKMTAKERDERYPRCADVATALGSWLETIPKASRVEPGTLVQKLLGAKIAEKLKVQGSPEKARSDVPCPTCGKPNAPENRFCGGCGGALGSQSHGGGTSRSRSAPLAPSTQRGGPQVLGPSPNTPGTGTRSGTGSGPRRDSGSSSGTVLGLGSTSSAAASLTGSAAAQISGAMKDLSSLMASEKRTATVLT